MCGGAWNFDQNGLINTQILVLISIAASLAGIIWLSKELQTIAIAVVTCPRSSDSRLPILSILDSVASF